MRQSYGNNTYMRGFLHDLYLRSSCYACMAKGGRSQNDLTLGDYWGVERTCPDLDQALDENKDMSAVLTHNAQGQCPWSELTCRSQETTYASAVAGNLSIERSVVEPPKCQLFFE